MKFPVPVVMSFITLANSKQLLYGLNGRCVFRATFCERLTLECDVLVGKHSSTPYRFDSK